jgi:glutamate-1-semialdehyde 2,1-aminomutase
MTSNAEILKRAYQILPGNSLGSFYLPEGHEFVIERGEGSKVYDAEGREYLDFVLGSELRARS